MLKDEYPLVIADLLGIPRIDGSGGPWVSTEGTVLVDWLKAVGEALDVPYAGQKVRMMQRLVERVGQEWDPATCASELTPSRGGGNIRTPAFERLHLGLQSQAVARQRRAVNDGSPPFEPSSSARFEDALTLRSIRTRRGQPAFRAALLEAYDGVCAISGCDAAAALEAAHIRPHFAGGRYVATNGLLLRADLHTLFDMRLLAVVPESMAVALHPEVEHGHYRELHGRRCRTPQRLADRPDPGALQEHLDACKF